MPGDDLSRGAAFNAGVAAVGPLLLGVAPFGLVAGAAVVDAGLGLSHNAGFSMVIFAGAAQLAALDLLASGAPAAVAVATALVINARHVMYSAALAPYFAAKPLRSRAAAAYLLTDQAFAVTITRLNTQPGFVPWLAFYFGAGLALWGTWQVTTVAGIVVGGAVPDSVPLSFAVPLTFLALLVPSVVDRPTLTAAVTGATVATLAAPLSWNLGMLAGSAAGIGAGFLHSLRRGDPRSAARSRP